MRKNDDSWDLKSVNPLKDISQELRDPDNLNLSEQKKDRFTQDTRFRKLFSYWIIVIIPIWLILTILLMFFTGFGLTTFSDAAIVALLTTTTANVLGLAFIVLKGMFPEGR